MKRLFAKQLYGLIICIVIGLFTGCNKSNKLATVNPAFSKYISAYTSGVVSKTNSIKIQLASTANISHTLNETIKENLFHFSPSVSGKSFWIDERTIEFKPDQLLKPNQLYNISFDLGKIMQVPSEFKTFDFNIQVIQPAFSIQIKGLRAVNDSRNLMILEGDLLTADIEDNQKVEKLLQITSTASFSPVRWQHNEANKTHTFIIDSIERKSTSYKFKLQWNGEPIQAKNSDQTDIEIPAEGVFKVLSVKPVQEDEEYTLVQFSDPIAINQDLNGLIVLSEQQDVSYAVNGSEVKIFTSNVLDGNFKVTVNEGVTNLWGSKLGKSFTANVFFENRLPVVKIHGRGNILPGSAGKLVLPFEAINLKAVDVSIIKIYENNIAQFFQSNDYNGDQLLRQVATPIVKATIQLDVDETLNLHRKNRFSLDLDKYIKTEPGALYRVNIGFRPEYSLYNCLPKTKRVVIVNKSGVAVDSVIVQNGSGSIETTETEEEEGDYYNDSYSTNNQAIDSEEDFWARYDNYYPYGYSWNQRNNPCSKSYYNKERFASRNILATNIGLTAKRGSENALTVIATNFIDTKPFSGVQLEVLDFQRQVIGTATTDNYGVADLQLKRKGFLLIAKKGNEKSYLKIDDGSSLPLSRFDVSGTEVKSGIKGFVFGERGVWRPGDSLYLNCIIEDKENKLPANHPVELELYTPNGQLYKKLIQTNPESGFNVFRTATDVGAPTGNWTCKVKLGGAVFEKKIKIETIMPNRLKINVDFGTNAELGKGYTGTGTLTAKWLFGATAKKLKAKVDMQLYKSTTAFPNYSTFIFDNPTASYETQSKNLFDGLLNEEGKALIKPDFTGITNAPGVLTANMLIKVFEPGGNFSIDNSSYTYHPYASYTGIKLPQGEKPWGYLQAGKNQTVQIINVDTKGNLLTNNSIAEVELYRIQWRWWWDNTGDDLSNFTTDQLNKLIKKETVQLSQGKGSYGFNIKADDWGRYMVLVRDVQSGHVTGTTFYIDDPYWQTRDNKDDPSAASMLSFSTDKEKYQIGENVQITIPSSKGGRALISIENGSRVIKTYWTETQQGQTKYSFKAEKGMAPNIYVNVSLFQPHAQTINDLPIRMYGVVPVTIEDNNTILKPVIKMPDEIRPEQSNTMYVSEANGKEMAYVIAIVDEGLLDITRFKTPNPHKVFYGREALGVKSWDLYDYVIGAWGGELERILTIGGDSEAMAPGNKKANRFPPVVKFLGPFKSKGGTTSHSFTLPSYMGSVRVMVIAAQKASYGFAEKNVVVKKPLMMLATLPRIVGPTEQINIPVTVFATKSNIRNVSVALQPNPLIEAVGAASQQIAFNGVGEQQLYFNARVKESAGLGVIKIVATSGSEKATYEVEVDVRNPNAVITNISDKTLIASQSITGAINAIGAGNESKAVIEITSIPAINLEKRLQYLITYPHGCIEQTVSAVFPQLYVNQLMDLNDQQKALVDLHIKRGIDKIKNFQSKDGGFSYWPNGANSDEWGTSYAGHFLIEAQLKGYNISSSIIQQWKVYERNKAINWNVTQAPYYGDDLSQAYRLYLLALAKAPEQGAMNRLKEYRFLTPEAKWRLASAYYLIGQNTIALQMISGLTYKFQYRTDPGATYGSQLRDQSMVLETLTIMNRKSEAELIVKDIANQLSQENWYSTQTTSYALLAISKYCGTNSTARKIHIKATVSGQNINISTERNLVQIPVAFKNGKSVYSVNNTGSNVLYMRIINRGQPIAGDTTSVIQHPEHLKINVAYINTAGNTVDPTTLQQGTDFVAKVTVTNTGHRGAYNQMALTQIFPSGWEILNTRLYNNEGAFTSSPVEYMDIRDDRVNHYFDIRQNQTLTFYVQLNAAYTGRYYWPGVYCENMYDNTISAGTRGKWVNVR